MLIPQELQLSQEYPWNLLMLVYCCSQINWDNMLTFKAEVLKSKQKSDGTYNVKIRMTYNREVKRLATNIFVRQEDLTKSFKLKNPKFIQEADAIVRHYQEMCAKLQVDINNYTMDEIIGLSCNSWGINIC